LASTEHLAEITAIVPAIRAVLAGGPLMVSQSIYEDCWSIDFEAGCQRASSVEVLKKVTFAVTVKSY